MDGHRREAGQAARPNYNCLAPDIHWERGMECIDCDSSDKMHGDGNIYTKKEDGAKPSRI